MHNPSLSLGWRNAPDFHFENAPESVAKFSIEQVVSTAGDGALKDDSTCSAELREYLGKVGTSHRQKPRQHTMPHSSHLLSRHEPNDTASAKPGALQSPLRHARCKASTVTAIATRKLVLS